MEAQGVAQPTRAESIKVLVRIRPLSGAELAEGNDAVVDVQSGQSLSVTSGDGKKSFKCSFDAVLDQSSSQLEVYDVVRGCTDSVINGFNSTIFAYGQTGSGKTYSMYGPPSSHPTHVNTRAANRNPEQMGIIPRAIEEIFDLVQRRDLADFQVHCSFVQIYNENLYDMLRDASMNTPLSIREDNKEIYVQGLSEYNVKSVADTMQLLKIAEENRAIRETHMNMFSSRSHSIFQIQVEQKRIGEDGGEVTYRSKFNLVDLAGSEKWNTKLQMRDEHIAEMTNINLSLHTLGKCISALAQASQRQQRDSDSRAQTAQLQQQRDRERERLSCADNWDTRSLGSLDHSGSTVGSIKDFPVPKAGGGRQASSATGSREPGTHVPFRESKLTRLLQDSLGGNAKTFLIATVSPARSNSEETISTLKFADRAKQVMVQAVVNESRPVDYALVKRLQQEVEMLKALLKRVVQSQQPAGGGGGAGGGGAVSVNAAVFNAKLKQASSAAEIGELLNLPGGGGGGSGSGAGSQMGSPHSGRNSRAYSPDTTRGGSDGGGLSASAGAEGGGGLEYIMSLEKALNQEQIHSQHLGKKNETLIKELEELKAQNLQLQHLQQGGHITAARMGLPGSSSPAPLSKQGSLSNLHADAAQVRQAVEAVQALLRENNKLAEQLEQVQKTMKKFFKFQIEEEDLKKNLEAVFAAAKDIRAGPASARAVDCVAYLEHLAAHAGTARACTLPTAVEGPGASSASPPRVTSAYERDPAQDYAHTTPGNIATSQTAPTAGQGSTRNHYHQHHQASRKQLRRVADPPPGGQLPAMEHPAMISGSGMGVTVAGVPVRENKKSHAYLAQQELAQQRNLPSLQPSATTPAAARYSSHVDEASYTVQRGRDLYSAGSDDGAAPLHHENQYNTQQGAGSPLRYLQQHQGQNQGHHGQFQSSALDPPQPSAPVALSLSFRVRGPPGQQPGGGGGLASNSVSSLGSSGGWLVAEEDAVAAEAALKAELRQAKKKMKKQQQMTEWQRIKEEKARAEAEAAAAERAAEAEAEALKEQRRREYAQKQKQKLAQYQSKVKSEAEKIQELKNLGIDPTSLFP